MLEDPWDEPPAEAFAWTVDPGEGAERAGVRRDRVRAGQAGRARRPEDGRRAADRTPQPARRQARRRPDRPRREPAGRHQVARAVRGARGGRSCTRPTASWRRLCLSKQAQRFKTLVAQEYADLIYNGLWFSAFHQDLFAFVASNQRFVSGDVRVKLFKGKRPWSSAARASTASTARSWRPTRTGDQFDHDAAKGFIRLWGLSQQTQARHQLLKGSPNITVPSIMPPAD